MDTSDNGATGVVDGPGPTDIERQIRLLLVAWPWIDRLERSDELVALTLDSLPAAAAAARLPRRIAIDLVRSGLWVRLRRRPPIHRWLWYRATGDLSPRWNRWLANDLAKPGYGTRIAARTGALVFAIVFGVLLLSVGPSAALVLGLLIATLVATWEWRRAAVQRTIVIRNNWYRLGASPVTSGGWHVEARPALIPNLPATAFLSMLAVPLLGSSAIVLTHTAPDLDLSRGTTFAAVFAINAALTLLLLGLLGRRLRRLPDPLPPAEISHRSTPWLVALGAVVIAPLGLLDWQVLTGRSVPGLGSDAFSVVPYGIGFGLAALACAIRSRSGGRPLGLWDVLPFWSTSSKADTVWVPASLGPDQ